MRTARGGARADTGGRRSPRARRDANAAPEAERRYSALSTTATAITGDLTLSYAEGGAVTLAAAKGVTLSLSPIDSQSASDEVAGQAWTGALPIPAAAAVQVFAVEGDAAPLCGAGAVSHVAFADYVDGLGERALQIAAFASQSWPPAALEPCGTYTYVLSEEPAPAASQETAP